MQTMGAAWLVLAASLVLSGQSNEIRYFYDDSSQLFRVLDSAGALVEYVYDPVGNILEIKRSTVAPTSLSILNITPQYAKPGTTIRIYGQNFSPTLAANVVRLNGIAATVLSASSTELTLVVPAGDTTGPVTVTVGGQTVSSGTLLFRGVRIPVITKVTPATIVAPGAPFALIVEGTDLDEAILGTFPAGGFALPMAPNVAGLPGPVQAYAGLPGVYAVIATNLAGTSSTTLSAANQLRVGDAPGPKETVGKIVSLQNGNKEAIGYPAGLREAISKAVSMQNGATEVLGYPTGRREANAIMTSVQNGSLDSLGFPAGRRESFAALTSVRNGSQSLLSNSALSNSWPEGGVREIQLNHARLIEAGDLSIGAGETISFSVVDLNDPRILLGGSQLQSDPENPNRWTLTLPTQVAELTLQVEGVAQGGEAVRVSTRLKVHPETFRPIQAIVLDVTDAAVADAAVKVAQSGWLAEYFDLGQPMVQLPSLDNVNVAFRRTISGMHLRNPNAGLGRDPRGVQLLPDLAVRARSRIRVLEDGLHRFHLRAPEGTRVEIGGEIAEVKSGARFVAIELNLTRGEVPLEVTWVESDAAAEVELFYATPGRQLQGIPPELLYCEPTQWLRTGADGLLTTQPISSGVSNVRLTLATPGGSEVAPAENSWLVPVRRLDAGTVTLRKTVTAGSPN